ncbi:hypothetical protein [Pedobacter sp. Leaf194]|uniref:hypothetical protein n=1 Tax=Pedobacter sp. Leaf194 TaxID=1736297 RepID=UPI0007028263|nr:hypothetical protein [Pedobacter sp. Leaf194]KQS34498.1 hypothetical protein ASG14_15375 [Pedobacter sp. Leaf194]
MEPNLCILTFPQYYKNGRITFNIVIIPRNLNPLLPLQAGLPAFADAKILFKAMVINSLEGLPLSGSAVQSSSLIIEDQIASSREVWEALKVQMEASDGMKITDAESAKSEQRSAHAIDKYKNVSIKKYLPESYRASFNYVRARSKYALTGDEYSCAVKNKNPENTDTGSHRDALSWGKVIALCLRNPALAQKGGLIYKASIAVNDSAGLFEKGGWLYCGFAAGSPFEGLDDMQYAARIPALKGLQERILFSAVQFPVSAVANNSVGYDEVLRDAIVYDDGFAKIVHANQPVNQDLLQEKDNSNPPLKDIGIRLGWDDEQIAVWYNRQMLKKEEQTDAPVDAPLGVFGYKVDVRKKGEELWLSQNSLVLQHNTALKNGQLVISNAGEIIEPGIEIHPAAHGDSQGSGFWLPMYFSSWIGKPVTIADKDAEDINMLRPDKMIEPRPGIKNSINSIPKRTFHPYLADPANALALVYGNDYQFRVRLMDISGGGPPAAAKALNGGEKPVADLHFKRHIAAGALKILNINDVFDKLPAKEVKPIIDTSILQNIITADRPVLKIKRPLLGYPAVVFTGKYTDAVGKLSAILNDLPPGERKSVDIGLCDPDVDCFKVRVEVKSLEMDNGRSENGKESFIILYEKKFAFEAAENNYDQEFPVTVVYKEYDVVDFTGAFDDTGSESELVLPTSRHIRLTFTPIISAANNDYADSSILEGKKLILTAYQASKTELNLLSKIDGGFKALYLQPENAVDQNQVKIYKTMVTLNLVKSSTPVEVSRLADAFNLIAHNLTLEGEKGKRLQFGCSKMLRHSLAPDSSSISFSSLGELFNHWMIGVNFSLNRDWAWDGLERESFSVFRKWKRKGDMNFSNEVLAGTINFSNTVAINALSDPERSYSRLLFLDAFDPKEAATPFPAEIILSYRIETHFKKDGRPARADLDITDQELHLPVTIIPAQIPKLISAGIALSPYIADEQKYASTESRQRFLWLEMDAPPIDPNDTYFARVLSNAPDPLLSLVTQKLMTYDPVDPPLNINDEKVRAIVAGMDNDFAGIGAMQEMLKGDDASGRSNFYMLPLPPGLNADSDEVFGFFSYEIRVGHNKDLWSTAQARYGRPLKVNGVQHPAPNLNCNVFRRKIPVFSRSLKEKVLISRGEKISKIPSRLVTTAPVKTTFLNEIVITAPFATAVLNGENVTANPPQTSLWYMLYTQVRQADGASYRNLLLSSGNMAYVPPKRRVLGKNELALKSEGTKSGIAVLKLEEVQQKLSELGLSSESSLSVLCVEMFPMENMWQTEDAKNRALVESAAARQPLNPLTTGLGSYRIYRTSALVPVADVCCDDC